LNADAQRDYELIMGGIAELAQAAPYLARGMADLILGMLSPDDPEVDGFVRGIARHREEVLTFLNDLGLLADASATLVSDATAMTSTLTLNNTASLQVLWLGSMGTFMLLGMRESSYGYDEPYPVYEEGVAPTPVGP
jgi:hypothetical protein